MGTSKGYLPPTSTEWKNAKGSLTTHMNSFSNHQRDNSHRGKAVSDYAKAHDSGNKYGAVGKAGSKVIGLFQLINEQGIEKALNEVGLSQLIGKSSSEVFNGLINYFSEGDGTIEDAIVRDSITQLLTNLDINGIEDLEQVSGENVLIDFIVTYIQVDFRTQFFEKIQANRSIEESKAIINSINEYIDFSIKTSYSPESISKINWRSKEGQEFISAKCKQCYNILMSMGEE